MRKDHYYRRGTSEADLLTLRNTIGAELDKVKTADSISPPGINYHFVVKKIEDLEKQMDAILYALYMIDNTEYPGGKPEPLTYIEYFG